MASLSLRTAARDARKRAHAWHRQRNPCVLAHEFAQTVESASVSSNSLRNRQRTHVHRAPRPSRSRGAGHCCTAVSGDSGGICGRAIRRQGSAASLPRRPEPRYDAERPRRPCHVHAIAALRLVRHRLVSNCQLPRIDLLHTGTVDHDRPAVREACCQRSRCRSAACTIVRRASRLVCAAATHARGFFLAHAAAVPQKLVGDCYCR